MAKRMISTVVISLGLSGGAAQAQDIGFGGSIGIVSDYVASGESQTGRRPALQFTGFAYVPQGFYAGIFVSNVAFSEQWTDYYFGFPIDIPDSIEFAIFAGFEYHTDFGMTFDIGYERYFYDDSGNCCGLLYLGADYEVSEMVEVGTRITLDPSSGDTNVRGALAVYPSENIGLRAMIGRNQGNFDPDDPVDGRGDSLSAVNYWNLGIDYFFTDSVNISLDYHNSTSKVRTSNFVVGVTYTF